MLDLKKLLTKILQELKYSKLNTSNYTAGKGNTVSFSVDNNTGEVSVTSQGIEITPNQINGNISASKITGLPAASTSSPQPVGTSAIAGTATTWSKSDHVHNISKDTIIGALEYTPYDSSNPDGYGKITGISSTAPINSSGTTGTINLSHSTSGVTAGTYGSTSTATETPAFGANIIVPGFNVNNTGHITTASTHNITIPSNTFTAATSAAAGQKGLVPATSTLTTATFDGTTGLSNYWLNANGNWASIPQAFYSVNSQTWSGGLMPGRAFINTYMVGKRAYYHYNNPDGFNLTGGYTFQTYDFLNETSSWILYRVTFVVVYGATTTNVNNTIALTISSKQNNSQVESYTQYYTVHNNNDRKEKISTVALLDIGSQKTLTIEASVYTNKKTPIYETRMIGQPVAWGV